MSSREKRLKRQIRAAKAKESAAEKRLAEKKANLASAKDALAEALRASDAQLPPEELGVYVPDTGAGPFTNPMPITMKEDESATSFVSPVNTVDGYVDEKDHITVPAERLPDGTVKIDLGGGQDAVLIDRKEDQATERRRTVAPRIDGPKDLPGLRAHLVDRVNWLRMNNEDRILAQRDAVDLEMAKLWWVSDDVSRLIISQALTIPDDVSLADIALPSHAHGFAIFPTPIATIDDVWNIAAVDWHPVQFMVARSTGEHHEVEIEPTGLTDTVTGIRFTWWVAPDLTNGFDPQQMTSPVGRTALQREIEMQEHHYGPHRRQASLEGATWIPFGTTTWLAGSTISDDSAGEPRINYTNEPDFPSTDPRYIEGMEEATIIRKLVLSLWAISRAEKIVETRDAPEARHERRRRAREGHGTDAVQVVQLRPRPRGEAGEGTGEHREYHHRWIVSGHFRWQAHGPDRKWRKLIYIEPHLKGPDGAPILDPTKVFKVS